MSREKQIAEIARDFNKGMCTDREVVESCADCAGASEGCALYQIAEKIYNAGYRKQGWISVDERLPDEVYGDEIIICTEDGVVGAGRYDGEFSWMANEGSDFYDLGTDSRVTHWMPLPEAPKMKGGAE